MQVGLLMLSAYSAETQHLKSPFVPNIPVHAGRTGQLEMAPT